MSAALRTNPGGYFSKFETIVLASSAAAEGSAFHRECRAK